MKTIFAITAAISAATVTPAYAYDTSFDGKVTMIEPTYVPEGIIFQLDKGAGSCPAGASLAWNVRGSTDATKSANSQAILSALMTAQTSGRNVRAFVYLSNCSVEFLHSL